MWYKKVYKGWAWEGEGVNGICNRVNGICNIRVNGI